MGYIYPTAVHSVSDTFSDHVARGSVNPGVDYTAGYGSPVYAVAAGTVTDADSSNSGGGGRTVHIDHDDGTGSDYLHLSDVETVAGRWVAQGAYLGLSGASGNGSDWYYGPHLHISFRPNHAHGYGNSGNQDFDAIMRGQGNTTPPKPADSKEDREMRIVTVPGGTIALVGEYTSHKYTSTTGSEGFSYGANMAAYGTSSGLTEDQVSTLASESATRYNGLVNAIASKVESDLSSVSSTSRSSAFWALIVGAVLLILAVVVVPILVATVPGATPTLTTLANFLIGAGAVLIGFALSSFRNGGTPPAPGTGRHVEAPAPVAPPTD